jgi:hypothetical protein
MSPKQSRARRIVSAVLRIVAGVVVGLGLSEYG